MIALLNSDARRIPLADQSVQCIITSPPYYGLRDYGTATWEGGSEECDHKIDKSAGVMSSTLQGGKSTTNHQQEASYTNVCAKCGARRIDAQIGLEASPAAYVASIVAVMRECWRVLKNDGVMWLNLGDSYAMSSVRGENSKFSGAVGAHKGYEQGSMRLGSKQIPDGLKSKDLIGIPWRVAFALQEDGWYLRSDIIWHKPNPMPESVTDRPTKAHEYVFLLTKQARYYYDAIAIQETSSGVNGGGFSGKTAEAQLNHGAMMLDRPIDNGFRNRRSVWTVATSPYSGAHFATFPPKLIEPMILAGTSERGECPHCGKAWVRVVEKNGGNWEDRKASGEPMRYGMNNNKGEVITNYGGSESVTIGWQPQCSCPLHEPIPQIVFDPFAGTATVGRVAIQHGRRFVGCDLNTSYIDLAHERTSKIQITMPL